MYNNNQLVKNVFYCIVFMHLNECWMNAQTPNTFECHLLSIKMWWILLWVSVSGDVQANLRMLWCGNMLIIIIINNN
jgi:hypothetical protein